MKKIFVLLSLILSFNVLATESMRNCMLLPIVDGFDNKIGFKVFEEIENYIKEGNWCTYKSNSELINILSQYSKNLEEHLGNKDVLKVIADKTKAGTMIRVTLQMQAGLTEVKVEIIGENGEDRYFKEQTQLKSNDGSLIAQTIKNWLDVYEKTIPYDGRIKGVLGDQFTIDIGKKSHIYNGSEIIIERPTTKRQHPLLKEIIDYQTEKIAEAKVFDVSDNQAQAKITSYEGQKKLRLEDWVKVRASEQRKAVEQLSYAEKDKEDFGKLGTVGLFLNIGSGSVTQAGTSEKSMNGLLYGVDIEAEIWATRNYWVGLDLGKKFGRYTKDQGTFTTDSNSTSNSTTRIKFGYKYLPMGFFYGPQVDAFVGYANYDYGLSTNTSDGYTDFSFSGLLLGTRGSIPVFESTRLYLLFDFLMSSTYKEKVVILGSDESSSNYHLEFGGQYLYAPNITLSGGVSVLSNKANFTGVTKEEQFKDVSAKLGTIFTF
ncbi:MAG: hypothetical protein PHY93_10055 [Bacteriovorax sp.]|nr:hypothetical protein [Bacteriovorax sp.]